jgi:hypothetical protein
LFPWEQQAQRKFGHGDTHGAIAGMEYSAMCDQKKRTDITFTFVVWAAIILVGLALLSVASGTAPLSEPATFPLP